MKKLPPILKKLLNNNALFIAETIYLILDSDVLTRSFFDVCAKPNLTTAVIRFAMAGAQRILVRALSRRNPFSGNCSRVEKLTGKLISPRVYLYNILVYIGSFIINNKNQNTAVGVRDVRKKRASSSSDGTFISKVARAVVQRG